MLGNIEERCRGSYNCGGNNTHIRLKPAPAHHQHTNGRKPSQQHRGQLNTDATEPKAGDTEFLQKVIRRIHNKEAAWLAKRHSRTGECTLLFACIQAAWCIEHCQHQHTAKCQAKQQVACDKPEPVQGVIG